LGWSASGTEVSPAAQFRKDIQPLLAEYCYDCHGDGARKGGVAFDELNSDPAILDPGLWLKVLKNTRAGLMPPQKKPRPSYAEQQKLEQWIKYGAFGIDPKNPDPGRVTVRRLNRVEYRNTIHDLMGIDFNAEVEFPPDDTGYGFDNIGDVLTLSPMLLEKYLAAADAIVREAVPVVSKAIQERIVPGNRFSPGEAKQGSDDGRGNRREGLLALSYYEPAAVSSTFTVDTAGSYSLGLELAVKGGFEFDPGRCRAVFKIDGREVLNQEFGWHDSKTFHFDFNEHWQPGERRMTFELEPLTPVEQKDHAIELRLVQVTVRGPREQEHWVPPKNYARFFTKEAPQEPAQRRAYASEVLGRFTARAFRRPVDQKTVERLVTLAEAVYRQPGKTFEAGIAHAMVAVLASPRFLFRLEEPSEKKPGTTTANVDEYALASRLSYFLWSTMPDEELLRLAKHGELRRDLRAQITRMLADSRSEGLIKNFTGQWLQTRNVEGISINARAVLARDSGQERQMREKQEAFRAQFALGANRPDAPTPPAPGSRNTLAPTNSATQTNASAQHRVNANRRRSPPRFELDRELRDAMCRETEMFFASIVREDRPVTELIESDYTFLNEKLAKLYGITNVTGAEMRRVTLPGDSHRGGVLTQGSALVITSNPDRTSPVKRGLFILENFLGTPPPPPPPNIPALEVAEQGVHDHELTLREALQVHRDKPMCSSCHARMDPIGLAFENFNALGMWREKERNQTIETAGTLITGEAFNGVRDLKRIIVDEHRADFYRCFTEKLLTYALGRGTEYYDLETIDQIVARLERENGRFSALLTGVIESAPFQRMRTQATATAFRSGNEPDGSPSPKQLTQNDTKP